MKSLVTLRVFAVAATLSIVCANITYAAQGSDPEWPCIQRKVPELSLAQIWTGKELSQSASDWKSDPSLAELVRELAARRMPLSEADDHIDNFAKSLGPEERFERLSQLIMGLFDFMNHERTHVISGIARYARGQNSMAEYLRSESSDLEKLRQDSNANILEVDRRQENLLFRMRVFQERAQSLTYVCEVPTLVEQRLFALVKSVGKHMDK